MDEQLKKGHLPLFVMAIIGERPIHGYALAREIQRRGGRRLAMGEGTLYPLLYRLEAQGLVRASWETGPAGKRRKVYALTARGKRKLRLGREDWTELCRLVGLFLGREWGIS